MRYVVTGAMAVVLAGCGTMTNPLAHMKPDYSAVPVETLQEVAREVEEAVRSSNRTPTIADRDGVVVTTDVVQQTTRTRAARWERLDALLATGHAVERRNGLVAILRTKAYKDATESRDRDRNALLVVGENRDRWALYEGLLEASHYPRRSLSAIQTIFHEARVEGLAPGRKYEDASGAVVTTP